jgi:hypothetical protein
MYQGHDGERSYREEQAAFERLSAAKDSEGEVDVTPLDQGGKPQTAFFEQMDLDLGPRFQVPGQKRRQEALDRLWRRADAKHTRLAPTHGLRVLTELCCSGQEVATA